MEGLAKRAYVVVDMKEPEKPKNTKQIVGASYGAGGALGLGWGISNAIEHGEFNPREISPHLAAGGITGALTGTLLAGTLTGMAHHGYKKQLKQYDEFKAEHPHGMAFDLSPYFQEHEEKKAEFREDHWQPKQTNQSKSHKKEIAEDVMLGGLGAKAGGVIGGGIGLAKGKQNPLENPVGVNEVKTRQARKIVNNALHNHQAKWSGVKGGLIGAGVGLGLAGAGILAGKVKSSEQKHEQEKIALELPRELTLYGVIDSLYHHRKTASDHDTDPNIPNETKSHQLTKKHKPWQVPMINLVESDAIAPGHTTIHTEKPSLLNRMHSDLTHKQIQYGINRSSDYAQVPDIPQALSFVERTANPATRRETINDLFSDDQLHRYENITPRPLLFGKDKWEKEILKPKKNVVLDVADQGGNYHPIMQATSKHWAETGRGIHTKKS